MCGIVGLCGFTEDFTLQRGKFAEALTTMRLRLNGHKEEAGIFIEPCCAMGQGAEPVIKKVGSKTYAIAFYGEIYNINEIKGILTVDGSAIDAKTNAEIILEGFIRHGADFVNSVNGVFAYAIWDGESLWIFRDRAGIKSIYFSITENRIIFASEIKGVLAYPGMKAVIGREGLCQIFGLGPARAGGSGVFEGINEIKAGYFGKYGRDGFKEYKYWDVESKPHDDGYEETVEKTSWLVKDSIKRQLQSETSICSMLSGGLDSSVVTAVAAAELKEKGKAIDTFSFDFDGNDKYFTASAFQPDRDRPWVDIMVQFTGSNHRYLECGTQKMAELLYDSVRAKDLPGMADIDSSLLYFCGKVKKYDNVALSGECSDEIFGGYPWFHKKEMLEAETFPWSMDLETRKALLTGDLLNSIDIDGYVNEKYCESIKAVPRLEGEGKEEARRREIAYLNLKWFMATLIDRLDRISTYAGLNVRAPFADYRIIEYIWNVPWDIKCKGGEVKHLLRAASEGILPEGILHRKKSPYPKSYNPEYEEILSGRVLDILHDGTSPLLNLVDKKKVEGFIASTHDYGKPWFGQLMAGPQRLAYLIQIDFWLREYGITVKM